jgi:hypothetical protein
MGLFVGTGNDENGSPALELERPMSRLESLAVLIRLLGLEDTASKAAAVNPFIDAPDWGAKTAAYAYAIGLTVGINDERALYAPDRLISAKEFTAFLLRALGYHESSNDFKFEESLEKAVSFKLYKIIEPAKLKGAEFLRAEAVIAIADALISFRKGSELRLIDKLEADSVVDGQMALDFIAAYNSAKKY